MGKLVDDVDVYVMGSVGDDFDIGGFVFGVYVGFFDFLDFGELFFGDFVDFVLIWFG